MKLLKIIFALNGRLDRKGYLLLGVLPMFGFVLLTLMPFIDEINFIIVLSLFVPILILALISAVKRGRDIGLNGLVTLFLFVAVPMLLIILARQIKIDTLYVAFLFIAYLLLIPSSSKELKIIGKFEYVFTMIFIILVFPVFAAFVVPTVPCAGEKVKIDLVCVNMRGNAQALKMFKLDNGVFPSTKEGNEALLSNPDILKYPNYAVDAYLYKLPKDSWGGKMVYLKIKDGFELISYGADRREGGEDEYADIYYSECGE